MLLSRNFFNLTLNFPPILSSLENFKNVVVNLAVTIFMNENFNYLSFP